METTKRKNVVPIPYMPNFVHRRNGESFESFCPSCFATVAKALLEVELESKEHNHVCNPWDLKRFQNAARLFQDAAKLGFVA